MDILTVILVILIPVLTIFAKGNWKKTNWAGKTLLIAGIILASLGAFTNYKKVQKEKLLERINSKFGTFEDLSGATIPELCIGRSDNSWPVTNPTGTFAYNNGQPMFRIYVRNNKLFIDIILRDKDGHPIAAIDGNEWTLYSNDYEYNNDETSFELVTKGDRKVYFNVELKDGKAHILGVVLNNKGYGVQFSDYNEDGVANFFGLSIIIMPGAKDEVYKVNGGRIFKYPREKYLGVRLP